MRVDSDVSRARGRILLAEDDAAMQDLLADYLVAKGYEVLLAEDGLQLAQTLEILLADRDPALAAVVADYRMPGIDGLAVLDWMEARGPHPPFVLISAFATDDLQADACRRGAAAVLGKPFPMQTLLDVLGNVRK